MHKSTSLCQHKITLRRCIIYTFKKYREEVYVWIFVCFIIFESCVIIILRFPLFLLFAHLFHGEKNIKFLKIK